MRVWLLLLTLLLIGLYSDTLLAQPIGARQDIFVHPDYSAKRSVRIKSMPENVAAVPRLELALLEQGIPVVADHQLLRRETTANLQVTVADTSFRRPYRELIGIPLFAPQPSDYLITVTGNFPILRYQPLATRLEIRVIEETSGRLLAVYTFQQRCNLSSEILDTTLQRFARALRVGDETDQTN